MFIYALLCVGVPMCVTQVRAMVQKPITLRARVLLQWNGDTKYLMRMMDVSTTEKASGATEYSYLQCMYNAA